MSDAADRTIRPKSLEEARAVRAHGKRLCEESRAKITASAALIAKSRAYGTLDSAFVSALAIQRRELRAIVVEAAVLARHNALPRDAVLGLPRLPEPADDAMTSVEREALAVVSQEAIGWFEEAFAV